VLSGTGELIMLKMPFQMKNLWNLSNALWVVLLALLAVVGLVACGGGSEGVLTGRLLALLPLFAGLLPFVSFASDDGEEEEAENERARTIVAMPAWMSEELQKEKARIESERAVKETPPAPFEEVAPEPIKAEASVPVEPDDDEAPEIAQTMAFNPAEAAAFREMTLKSETAPEAAPGPVPSPEPKAPTTAQTMAFDPAEAAAFKAEAEVDEAPAPPEEDMGMAATVMFDAREAGFDKMVMKQPAEEPAEEPAEKPGAVSSEPTAMPPEEDLESDETGAYTAEDVARLKGLLKQDRLPEPADDAMAGTMAYMPAVSQEIAENRDVAPERVDEGGARTMAYMPAAEGGETTMAYSPDDKQRILDAMKQGQSPAEAIEEVGSTQAYSPDQSAALREAFELLDQARSGAKGNSGLQAEARELLNSAVQTDPGVLREQAQDLLSRTGEVKVPSPAPPSVSTSPPLSEDLDAVGKGGMGTVPLIIILLLLLALAGGATAFILHFLGAIDLPVDLPQLNLFKE
jgi:hypothetical protein